MKTLLTAAALAIAFAAPAAQARTVKHPTGSHVSGGIHAQAAGAKKAPKKHAKKHAAKKGHKKTA